jgi:importin subunit alpha-2
LYEFGVIAPLCTYILETKEPKTIVVELDGLANILAAAEKMGECAKVSLHVKECGLLDRIGVLLEHEDIKIHPKSLAIFERYFSTNVNYSILLLIFRFFFDDYHSCSHSECLFDNLTIAEIF